MVRNYKRKTEDRWSKEDLVDALNAIKRNELTINDAAKQFGISRATLYRQYHKVIQLGGKCDITQFRTCGGNPILTNVEEYVLERTVIDLRNHGFPVSACDIKRMCYEYTESNLIPTLFNPEKRMASDDWYYAFLKRHPSVRTPRLARAPQLKKKKKEGKIKGRNQNIETRNTKNISPAGDYGNKFFVENCEGQMILGEIVNAREPDGETVPIKVEVKEENAPDDADENQTEEMDEMDGS